MTESSGLCPRSCTRDCLVYIGIPPQYLQCMITCRVHSYSIQLNSIKALQPAKFMSTNQDQNISEFLRQETVLFVCLMTCSSACLQFAGMPPKLSGCISFSAKFSMNLNCETCTTAVSYAQSQWALVQLYTPILSPDLNIFFSEQFPLA